MPSDQIEFHRAEDAEERGEGICRTCLAPIWNEGGTIGHRKHDEGWCDRIERGGDSLVCFRAVEYRHVPLTGREAAIYDRSYERGFAAAGAGESVNDFAGWHEFIEDIEDASMCICGVPALSHDVVYPPDSAAVTLPRRDRGERLMTTESAYTDYDVPRVFDEDMLWSYLDEHLNANGAMPQVVGIDAEGTPFIAWLNEEGGDCVGLRLVRLLPDDGGTSSTPTKVEAPAQGCTTALVYPVQIVAQAVIQR